MNTLTIPFIWCVLQVTLLTTAAAALYLLLRRFSPAARSLVPLVALLLVAALTLLALSPWPRWSVSSNQAVLSGEVVRSTERSRAEADEPSVRTTPERGRWRAIS